MNKEIEDKLKHLIYGTDTLLNQIEPKELKSLNEKLFIKYIETETSHFTITLNYKQGLLLRMLLMKELYSK